MGPQAGRDNWRAKQQGQGKHQDTPQDPSLPVSLPDRGVNPVTVPLRDEGGTKKYQPE